MTVGEVIAWIAKYCSDVDILLMARSVYSIEVNDNNIIIYTIDDNSSDITISTKGCD